MAKKGIQLIFITFLFSCAATVLTIVSMATENWVTSDLKVQDLDQLSSVKYGLFSGMLENNILATSRSDKISMICLFAENICAFSLKKTSEERETELQSILDDDTICQHTKIFPSNIAKDKYEYIINDKIDENFSFIFKDNPNNNATKVNKCDLSFINAGLWVVTLLFLVYSIVMGTVTAIFSVINTAGNPISPWLNIWGLYIWNGFAAGGHVFTMIMWGAQFGQFIKENVAISGTLTGDLNSKGYAVLGWSFWVIFLPLLLHLTNIGILYYRQYLINKEPATPTIKQNVDTDGMIFVY